MLATHGAQQTTGISHDIGKEQKKHIRADTTGTIHHHTQNFTMALH
jgi:hypothetical protein